MTAGDDSLSGRPGFERGHPHYYGAPVIDHLVEIVLKLGAELWVLRDRQAITEHLLATEGRVTPAMIEHFTPPPGLAEQLRRERTELQKRVYSCLYDGLDPREDEAFVAGVLEKKATRAR